MSARLASWISLLERSPEKIDVHGKHHAVLSFLDNSDSA